jgi:hypothetical protein
VLNSTFFEFFPPIKPLRILNPDRFGLDIMQPTIPQKQFLQYRWVAQFRHRL